MLQDRPMSLLEHLDELRRRLFLSAIVLTLATGFCFYFGYDILRDLIRGPLDALDPKTTNRFAQFSPLVAFMRPYLMGNNVIGHVPFRAASIMEVFMVKFKLSLLGGGIIASPFIFYQLWRFIGTGLLVRERNAVTRYIPLSLALFLAGLAFGYFGAMPMALMYLLTVDPSVELLLMYGQYFGTMLLMLVMFGLAFQLPLVTMALARLGIMSAKSLAGSRRYAIVIIFVAAAVITPSPEPFSQCLLAVPMVALYELGIWLARAAEKRAAKAA